MDIFERPAPPPGAESMRPQRIKALHRHMLQRCVQLARDAARRPCVAGRGNQFRRDAAEAPAKDELGAGAKIERKAFELDLGDFRRIDRVQLAFLDGDDAFWQPLALQLALAQYEIETRALGATLVEVDAGPQRAGN